MDLQAELNKAKIAAEENNLPLAQAILKKLIQQNPGSVEPWLVLADVVKNPDHARQCLERVLKINPGNATARQKLGQLDDPFGVLPAITHDGEKGESEGPPAYADSFETVQPETPAPESPVLKEETSLSVQPVKVQRPQQAAVQSKKRTQRPQKKSGRCLEISLVVIVLVVLCVIVFALIGQNVSPPQSGPTPTLEDARTVIIENMNTANAEDIDGYMDTIHPKASGRILTRNAMIGLFDKYDLRYDVYGLKILEQTEDEARVSFTLYTRKINGPAFQNNKISGVMILRLYQGSWKIFSQEVTDISNID